MELNVPPAYVWRNYIYCYDCAWADKCLTKGLKPVWDIEHGVTCENCDEEIPHV